MHGRYLFVIAAFALSSFAAPVPVAEVGDVDNKVLKRGPLFVPEGGPGLGQKREPMSIADGGPGHKR